jgi:hypothetical protein
MIESSERGEKGMKLYTWAVVKDCRIVGYVRAYSEWDALSAAKRKYGEHLFVERTYLGEVTYEV